MSSRLFSSRRAAVSLLLVAGLTLGAPALAGCTADSAPPAESDSAAPAETGAAEFSPATGQTVAAEQYTFTLPEGWGFPDGAPEGFDEATFASDLQDDDEYQDSLNILTSPAGEVTPDQVEDVGVTELENAGATEVRVLPRITAAGSESSHLTAGFAQDGVDYLIDQYYLTDAGQTYIVTFSFSPDTPQADRDALAQSVLSTWQWV